MTEDRVGASAAAAADPVVLATFLAEANAIRQELVSVHDELDDLRVAAMSGVGELAPPGGGIEDLAAFIDQLNATEQSTDEALVAVVAADQGPLACPAMDGTPVPLPPDAHPVESVETGRDRWSWRDLADDAMGILSTAGRAAWELSPPNQLWLLATDPLQFARNWWRAAGSAGQTLLLTAETAGLIFVAGNPALELTMWHLTGRSATVELSTSVLDFGRTLITEPDAVVRSLVRWDQLEEDPYSWFGATGTDIVIDAVTGRIGAHLTQPGPGLWHGPPPSTRLVGPTSPVLPPGRRGLLDHFRPAGRPTVHRPFWLPGSRFEVAPSPSPIGRRPLEIQRALESEWAPAPDVLSRRAGPFEPPEQWIDDVNPGGPHAPGRSANCIDCARAVEANWRGEDAVAAPLRLTTAKGTSLDRIEDWTGGRFQPASLQDIEHRLTELGPGSSAIVASTWDSGGAHAYNAVNQGGSVTWIDGQLGEVGPWPPRYARDVDLTLAVFLGPDGRLQ